MIITQKFNNKCNKKKRFKEWWFRKTKLWRIRKKIKKIYYKHFIKTSQHTNELIIYLSDFKGKYSKEQFEYALELFLKRNEIISFTQENVKSRDGYLLILTNENRSQERILERTLQEIDLNEVKTEPINQIKQISEQSDQTTKTEENAKPF